MSALDAAFRALTRSNVVNVAFVITGALVGERFVSGAFDSAWKSSNKGKLFDDLVADGIAKQ